MKTHTIRLKRRDYSPFLLSQNPFPYTPIPSCKPDVFVGQDRAISRLLDIVSTTFTTGRSSHAAIIGPYGSGKSHTLKYIEKLLEEAPQDSSDPRVVSCYIPSPGSRFLHVYREVVDKIGPHRIRGALQKRSHNSIPSNLARGFQSLVDDETHVEAWRWVLGENLRTRKRSRLGVSRNMDDTLALSALKHMIKLLREDGYQFLCILIDELETVNELYLYQKQSMFNNLRHMVDDNPEGLCTIFACTPAGWHEVLENSLALSRRLSRNLIYLSRMKKKEAIHLVQAYVQTCRTDLGRHKQKNPDQDLYPFTLDAIEELLELSKGNVGELLKYCNLTLDQAVDADVPQIDSENITQLLVESR